MANNRNSSSSSFSSITNAGGRGSTFKSNSQSTFDLFNINVKDAQKKTSQVFDFVKKRIADNEKIAIKSTNKIYGNMNKQTTKSAELLTKSFSKAYQEIDKISAKYAKANYDRINNSMNKLLTDTKAKYDSFYRDIDKQYNNTQSKSQDLIGNLDGLKVNLDTTEIANDIGKKLSAMQIQCKCICDCGGKTKSGDGKKESEGANFLKKMLSKKSDNPEGDKALEDIADNIDEGNKGSASKGSALIELGGMVLDTLKSIASKLIGMFIDGGKKFHDAYQSSYNQLSTAFATDRKGTYNLVKDGLNDLDDDFKGVINYADDFMPALEAVSKQGLMGDNAIAKAIRDSIDKKIMPWLDTASEQYVNMNTYLSEENLNTLKGQQLMLQNSQSGNRLLQSGVINTLTNELEPLLRNIDFNTGGATNLTGEAQTLMTSLVKNAKMTPQEAYEQVKAAIDVQKNQYGALTSGDTSKILMGIEAANGNGLTSMLQNSTKRISQMGAQTGSDVGASAVGTQLGLNLPAYTKENLAAVDYSLSNKALTDIDNAIKSGELTPSDPLEAYKSAVDNIEDKVTVTQEATNKIENTSAKTLGLWSTQIPLFWTWAGSVMTLLTGIGKWGIGKLLGKLVTGGGLGKLGGLFTNGSGAGAGKVLGSTGIKALGTVAGVAWMGYDAFKGSKKANSWFGEEASTSDRVYSAIGGAFGGTGKGIGEKGATTKGVLKNMGSNAAKGALVGSFAGPLGMAIGAGTGAILGAIGGKRIAKAFKKTANDIKGAVTTWKDPNKSLLTKLKDTAKGAGALMTAITGGISGILFRSLRHKIAGKVKDGINILKDGLVDAAKSIGNGFLKLGKQLGSFIGNGLKGLGNAIVSGIKTAASAVIKKFKGLKSVGKKLGNGLKKAGSLIASSIKKAGKAALEKIKESAVGKAASKVKSGASKAVSAVKSGAKKVASYLPFASGSDEIPYDGFLAKLHKGETVFNKVATKNIKELLGISGKSVGIGNSPILRNLEAIKSHLKLNKARIPKDFLNNYAKSLKNNLIGSFASGADNVSGGLSALHKGEMIASKGVAEAITSVTGISGKSVGSSLLNKFKENISKKSDDKFDDSRVIKAIETSTARIVKAITSDETGKSMDKLRQTIGKMRVSYDKSLVNMEPLADN